jgi:WD40 repeat protein
MRDPTVALAHAIRALEVRDDDANRRLALEALWAGPIAMHVDDSRNESATPAMSSDGAWLAGPGSPEGEYRGIRLFHRDDGRLEPQVFGRPDTGVESLRTVQIDPDETWLAGLTALGVTLWPRELRHPDVFRGPSDVLRPHLLLGHEGRVVSVDVSPDGLWIASGGADGTVRVWPMPDVTQQPIHTLPHEELLGLMKRLTNFRAVEDPTSATGYSIGYAPFTGWADYPEWYPLAANTEPVGDTERETP